VFSSPSERVCARPVARLDSDGVGIQRSTTLGIRKKRPIYRPLHLLDGQTKYGGRDARYRAKVCYMPRLTKR